MLFEEFIEQHGVNGVVAYVLDLSLSIANGEVGIDFGYVLGDEPVIQALGFIDVLFVAIADWFQPEKHFALFVHRFDVFLVAARRTGVTE